MQSYFTQWVASRPFDLRPLQWYQEELSLLEYKAVNSDVGQSTAMLAWSLLRVTFFLDLLLNPEDIDGMFSRTVSSFSSDYMTIQSVSKHFRHLSLIVKSVTIMGSEFEYRKGQWRLFTSPHRPELLCEWVLGALSPGVKWHGREADDTPSTCGQGQENVGLRIHCPICLHGVVLK
jgi:hypothetical protein